MDRDLEQQLQELQKQFAGLAKTLGSSSKTVLKNTRDNRTFANVQKMLSKSMDDYLKRVKKGDGIFHEFSDAIDAAKKDVKRFSRILTSIPSPMGLVVKGLTFLKDAVIGTGVAMAKTALALSDTTATIQSLEDLVDQGFGELPYAGKLLKEFSREIDSNVESFSQLAKSGATFGSSIVMLRKAQADSLMPLGKFTDLVAKNSGTLARLFGTVDQGVPQIAGLMDRLGRLTIDEFAKFGLTLDDTSEYLGTFLELQRARGNVERMTQSQLLQGTREYTKNLVTLSKLTGESVDTLNEQNMAMAADGVFQSQLAKMNADDANTLSLGISQLPPALQQLAKEFVGLGAPISETSRNLEAMSQGAFGDAIKQFQNTGDIVAFQNSIKSISADVMKNGEAFGDAALAGGSFGEALNAVAAAIGNIVDPEIVEREKAARGDNIVELVALRTETDRLKSAFETTRFKVLEPFIYNSEALIDVGEGLGNQFDKLTKTMKERLTPAIENFGRALMGKDVKEPTEFKNSAASLFSSPDGGSIISDFASSEMPMEFNTGTKGFRNFGTGTPAMLHGVEAVVPRNDIGQLADLLADLGSTTNTNNTSGDVITNNNTAMDMTTLNNNTKELVDLNKKVAQHLNTLITIGAMTEKNTKNTTNSLANMGDSLV
jgi:hypothetical protein